MEGDRAACEVTSLDRSALAINYRGFLDVALCALVQTHFVNSPFDELKPVAVEPRGERTFIRTGAEPDLGLYLARDRFVIETHTKGRGVLTAEYTRGERGWVPLRLTQTLGQTIVTIDHLEYGAAPHGGGSTRAQIVRFVRGEGEASPHSDVTISECQPY